MPSVFFTIAGSVWEERNTTGRSRVSSIISAASVPSIPLPKSMSMRMREIFWIGGSGLDWLIAVVNGTHLEAVLLEHLGFGHCDNCLVFDYQDFFWHYLPS